MTAVVEDDAVKMSRLAGRQLRDTDEWLEEDSDGLQTAGAAACGSLLECSWASGKIF